MPADTTPPTFGNDNPLAIQVGQTQTITSSLLSASDNVSSGANLHYTVTSGPSDGALLLNGSATTSFTQADINNGLVSYHETTSVSSATIDTFFYKVTDAAGNSTGTAPFQIDISVPADTTPPTFGNDNPLAIQVGQTQTITSSLLSASDNVSWAPTYTTL